METPYCPHKRRNSTLAIPAKRAASPLRKGSARALRHFDSFFRSPILLILLSRQKHFFVFFDKRADEF